MKYTVAKENGKAKINFEITREEWDKANVRAYDMNKDKYSLPGFRKGKVPMKVLTRHYGEGMFFDDAFNIVFQDGYSEVLETEKELIPVERPDVDFDDLGGEAVKFHAAVSLRPEVTLGAYKGLKLAKSSIPVTKEDIDAEIDKALTRGVRKVEAGPRAAVDGDLCNIDYSGAVDGKKFDGGTASDQELKLGSKSFIPGFEEQVIGMKPGEEKAINVTFPADYHSKELAGKQAVFMVKLNSILKEEKPEFNDEFVKDISKFETAAEYRADVESRLGESAKNREKTEDENVLFKTIVESSKAEIPECMINDYSQKMLQDFEYRLMYQGMKLEDYFKYTGQTEKDLLKSYEPQAKQAVMTRLCVEEIVKAEGLQITEEEIDSKLSEMAKAAGKAEAAFRKELDPRRLDYIENEILMDKLIEFLKQSNDWTDAPVKPQAKKEAAASDADGQGEAKAKKSVAKTTKSDTKE